MPMRYANEDDVLAQLRMTAADPQYTRLVRLENGLCDTFDHKVGTSFGVAPVAETRTVEAHWSWYPTWERDIAVYPSSSYLVLDTPIRSVTAIETSGDWNGVTWSGGTTLLADEYRLTNETDQGFYGIDGWPFTWAGVVRITGVWGDQATLT
ncbi:MAG: hypothetical protein M3Q75_01555, partial [Gemmatimonadota bacterium]|nr:hypothetical protein [Gemmatimonadota bacterium]